jgi:hypothetical protein
MNKILTYAVSLLCGIAFSFAAETEESSLKTSSAQQQFIKYELGLLGEKSWQLDSLVLFDGWDVVGSCIKYVTRAPYSHIGIAIKAVEDDEMLLFESTSQGPKQIFAGIMPQVQVNPASEVVLGYNGRVSSRKIIFEEGCEPDPVEVTKYVKGMLGTRYEKHMDQLAKSAWRANKDVYTREDEKTMFCSELAAHMLQYLDYLDKKITPDNYIPGNFSERMQSVELINGAALAPEFELTAPKKVKTNCCCCILL